MNKDIAKKRLEDDLYILNIKNELPKRKLVLAYDDSIPLSEPASYFKQLLCGTSEQNASKQFDIYLTNNSDFYKKTSDSIEMPIGRTLYLKRNCATVQQTFKIRGAIALNQNTARYIVYL